MMVPFNAAPPGVFTALLPQDDKMLRPMGHLENFEVYLHRIDAGPDDPPMMRVIRADTPQRAIMAALADPMPNGSEICKVEVMRPRAPRRPRPPSALMRRAGMLRRFW